MHHRVPQNVLTTTDAKCVALWQERRERLHAEVDSLYAKHQVATTNGDVSGLLDDFLDLPCDWPEQPSDFGISAQEFYDYELRLWRQQASELETSNDCITEAQHADLDVVKLFPYFIAVVLVFAEHTGIACSRPCWRAVHGVCSH